MFILRTVAACFLVLSCSVLHAQQSLPPAGVLYKGIILTSRSLQAVPGTTISNTATGVSVQANESGGFETYVRGGDTLLISHISYERKWLVLPLSLQEGAAGIIQLAEKSKVLPSVTVKRGLNAAEFQRNFVREDVPITQPMRFWDSTNYVAIMNSVSGSAEEAGVLNNRMQAEAASRKGIVPVVTLGNLLEVRRLFRKKKKR